MERLGAKAVQHIVELDHGVKAGIAGMEFHGIASAHNLVERDAVGRYRFLGYVVNWSGTTLYHSGDTLWHEELVPLLRPFGIDIALLPINGNKPERRVAGNLDGPEAARLAKAIGARLAIPCHYDLFEFNTATPDEFIAECQRLKQAFRVLEAGERHVISGP
jgi:L-ascorbate metabolism protein UlaG (beta-lactamase superfamily)